MIFEGLKRTDGTDVIGSGLSVGNRCATGKGLTPCGGAIVPS